MTDLNVPIPVIVTMIAASASIVVVAINSLVSGHRERMNRRRDAYSKALTAITQYEEFPYVVRRRKPEGLEDERIRISTEMRAVQEKLSYYLTWLHLESKSVSEAYETLVFNTRHIIGSEIRRAWSEPPVTSDSGMNMPDLGLGALKPF